MRLFFFFFGGPFVGKCSIEIGGWEQRKEIPGLN